MNASVGWALAVIAVSLGYLQWGWMGVVLAVTVIVFWLLLQLSRALRVMRKAGSASVGHVDSAVMLQARLREGMRLLEVIPLAGSLGRRPQQEPAGSAAASGVLEVFEWEDGSAAVVRLEFRRGRLQRWALLRPQPEAAPAAEPAREGERPLA